MQLLLYTPIYHKNRESISSVDKLLIPNTIKSIEIIRDERVCGLGDPYSEITSKYIFAQQYFLNGKFDALLTIEDDMIVPNNTISNLLVPNADVVYSLYVSRHDNKWLAYRKVNETGGYSYSDYPLLLENIKGKTIDVEGVGFGCTLIHRRVLEKISFQRRGNACCDWYFAVDCKRNNFIQKCNTQNLCGHISGRKILYPY